VTRNATIAINLVLLLSFAAMLVFSRPWAAYAGFLILGVGARTLKTVGPAASAAARAESMGSRAATLVMTSALAGVAYLAVFLSMWWLGDLWKVPAVIVGAIVVYTSMFRPREEGEGPQPDGSELPASERPSDSAAQS
jgi:hypothetical protein